MLNLPTPIDIECQQCGRLVEAGHLSPDMPVEATKCITAACPSCMPEWEGEAYLGFYQDVGGNVLDERRPDQ